jgi:type IV pilus assembly protein PilY1
VGGAANYVAANPEAPESLYLKGRVTPANFSAPITGHIVSYPNAAGTVADRAYVGDAEGRLWRIDLSSVDPEDWSADLFHDAYPAAGPGALGFSMLDVSPLETPPIISTDPVGRVTINISTGEQTMLKSGGRNSVWSLTERRNDDDGRILAYVNWVLDGSNAKNMGGTGDSALHFSVDGAMNPTGERVTGPMALFASTLYFTTYDPGTVDPYVCSPGNSYLWGVHYIQAGKTIDTPSEEPGEGPLPQFKDPGSDPPEMVRVIPLSEGGLAFGVGVMQKPTCMTTEDVDDPFLGYGSHKSISSVNPGSFQLVVQLGANQTTDARKVGVDTFDLEPPFAGSTIDAWAAILD